MENKASFLFRGSEWNSAYQRALMIKLNSLPHNANAFFNQH